MKPIFWPSIYFKWSYSRVMHRAEEILLSWKRRGKRAPTNDDDAAIIYENGIVPKLRETALFFLDTAHCGCTQHLIVLLPSRPLVRALITHGLVPIYTWAAVYTIMQWAEASWNLSVLKCLWNLHILLADMRRWRIDSVGWYVTVTQWLLL